MCVWGGGTMNPTLSLPILFLPQPLPPPGLRHVVGPAAGSSGTCRGSSDPPALPAFLSCSGKLVSPKWKNFKGLKLQWRDKIRLNNAIWRAWYMQCECWGAAREGRGGEEGRETESYSETWAHITREVQAGPP